MPRVPYCLINVRLQPGQRRAPHLHTGGRQGDQGLGPGPGADMSRGAGPVFGMRLEELLTIPRCSGGDDHTPGAGLR